MATEAGAVVMKFGMADAEDNGGAVKTGADVEGDAGSNAVGNVGGFTVPASFLMLSSVFKARETLYI
ncbi:MAG: hypothetical protein LBB49_00135 [Gracilibacteraceae bacterium]|nr:hypothetical protein [Gracilibacteraceae bacterium]